MPQPYAVPLRQRLATRARAHTYSCTHIQEVSTPDMAFGRQVRLMKGITGEYHLSMHNDPCMHFPMVAALDLQQSSQLQLGPNRLASEPRDFHQHLPCAAVSGRNLQR